MKRISFLIIASFVFSAKLSAKENIFRYHLMGETYSLDPSQIRGTSGSYLFHNIYRSLFSYSPSGQLKPEGAKKCRWVNEKELRCELKPTFWSNGKPIKGRHYIEAYRRLVDPKTRTVQSELLVTLKNAAKILDGDLSARKLGVTLETLGSKKEVLVFQFQTPDPEFIYKLAQPILAPVFRGTFPSRKDAETLITNGPYKIKKWTLGKRIRLEPNEYYSQSAKGLPEVEVLFIEDDITALKLYEAGKLSLLRRLPTYYIERMKHRNDFIRAPMARFDYLGFNIQSLPLELRKALSLSLNYQEMQKMLKADSPPGCPTLPHKYFKNIPCHKFDLKEAKKLIAKLKNQGQLKKRYSLTFSKQGGEDIQRQVEWFQHQWKKNLNLNIELKPIEGGMFYKYLKSTPLDLFRKGFAIDRPTCLAGLETLTAQHPENYIKLADPKYEKKLLRFREPLRKQKSVKHLCTQSMRHLLAHYYLIPLGEIKFTLLARPKWVGWQLNELNQLDLSELRLKSVSN